MDTKFTKGLWTHQKGDDWIYDDSKDDQVICCAMPVNNNYEVRRANAHLIAAAPDMYELLKEFLPMDEDGNGEFQYNEGSEYLGKKVTELLAKARGES